MTTDRSLIPIHSEGDRFMVTLGVDAHKRTHTIVVVDGQGRQLAVITIGTNTKDHLGLLKWAEQFGSDELLWAVEDCRHLSRRLERDLLSAGQSIVRVPPKIDGPRL